MSNLKNSKKPYNPKEVESEIYKLWEKSGFFNPDKLKLKKSNLKNFCIIMPPPNANAPLHLGHAVFVALQDIMTRYHRMKGEKTLWLPGADHAGFETQVVFDKKLEKEGRSRFQIPQEQLYKEILEFTLNNKKIMENQLRQLGASCDWSREKFTLDKDIIKIVYQTFEKLYKDGLVYRGERIVNWCVKHQTSLSELETKYIEKKDPLYYIKYGPLTLATVRPETKFGDTAVAVNPKDKRYQQYIGQEIEIETLLGKTKMKVISDEMVDINFGTGVVKITPAHDPNDFEMGEKHKLEIREVIDKFGRLNEKTGPYQGLKVMEARKKVAEDMEKNGLLEKIDENYTHTIATCYKCGSTIEPRIMKQWFVKIKPLAELAERAVKNNQVKFITKKYEKIFFHWMKNIRDWNISRQIIWGIPIPVKYCDNCSDVVVDINDVMTDCRKCKGKSANWRKETDTFDTWFSSGQWPFAALQANKPNDFKNFYPTSVMETGWDILFFWVARMLMLGIYATGKPPFKYVYLHGLVRDKDRQKMSKSKGNAIDPLGVVETYGADALRMALIVGNTPGNDIVISEEKIRGYQKFANKIWNASRFVLQQTENFKKPRTLTQKDKKILKELKEFSKKITKLMDSFKFYAAGEKIYHYFWHVFADKIIEEAKSGEIAPYVLREVLKTNLKLLHPFMPFITEKIWQEMDSVKAKQNNKNLLMIEKWPR